MTFAGFAAAAADGVMMAGHKRTEAIASLNSDAGHHHVLHLAAATAAAAAAKRCRVGCCPLPSTSRPHWFYLLERVPIFIFCENFSIA